MDGVLHAPSFLENPFPVRAFFDRETAHALTLRNLLQRLGYESLEALRARGFERGAATALRAAIADVCSLFAIELSAEQHAHLAAASPEQLRTLHAALLRDRRWPADI